MQPYTIFRSREKLCPVSVTASPSASEELLIDALPADMASPAVWSRYGVRRGLHYVTDQMYISFLRSSAVTMPDLFDILIRGLAEKQNSFTQVDLLDSKKDQLQELFFQLKTSPYMSYKYREQVANRLVSLYRDAQEEDSTSPGIVAGSLRHFYRFLLINKKLKLPSIALTPENNIYASWRAEGNRVFSVHFLSNGDARYVVLKPNNIHLERQIRVSGVGPAEQVMNYVRGYNVEEWACE